MKKKTLIIICLFFLLLQFIFLPEGGISELSHLFVHQSQDITIVIDAGHGGFDPGKVGINKAQEKDINLSIAYKLKKLLEEQDIHVIMTRKDKNGLYKQDDSNKKQKDMMKRISIINSSGALFAISIHQNSFTQESSKGAQVFYYENSAEGKILADILQETVKQYMNDGNHRLARPNRTYYLLRYSNCPLVIMECGFLTNPAEAELLCQDAYQDKIAWAIKLGILEYINQYKQENKIPLADKK